MIHFTRSPLFYHPVQRQRQSVCGNPSIYGFLSGLEKTLNGVALPASSNTCTRRRQSHIQHDVRVPFDISETDKNYQLVAEVPGFAQSDLKIEFTDRDVLQISGSRSRTVTETNIPEESENSSQPNEKEQITGQTKKGESSDTEMESTIKTHQPSVEDDYEDLGESDTASNTSSTSDDVVTAKAESNNEKDTEQAVKKKVDAEIDAVPRQRYWVSERVSGQFQRTFSFANKIDQNNVKASLKDGILQVIVPKVEPEGPKRINIE